MTPEEKQQEEYRRKHVELYMKKVVNPIFPKARVSGTFSLSSPESIHLSAKISHQNTNDYVHKSPYYFNGNTSFIHYTSFNSLLSILNDKAIRMHDFNYLNDPQEFAYSSKILDIPALSSNKGLKENLFALSMCHYDEKKKLIDTFDMWRLYGLSGNGVGIVLEFENSNRKNWLNYYLSKIYYEEKDLALLKKLKKKHEQYHLNYDFKVNNYYDNFYPLLGFHKNSIYKIENEVRLLRYVEKRRWDNHTDYSVKYFANAQYKKTAFSMLDLDCPERMQKFEKFKNKKDKQRVISLFPKIKIKKVILGYNYNVNDLYNINESIFTISQKNLGYGFPIEITTLKKHF